MNRVINSLVIAITLALGGCGLLPERGTPPELHDLGPAPLETQANSPASLGQVSAPSWLDTTDLQYRLLYADPYVVGAYAESRWIAPPAELLAGRLRARLDAGGETQARWLLTVTLDSFEQRFEAPGTAVAVIRLQAEVRDRASRELIASRTLARERPTPSADADGAVRALAALSDQMIEDVLAWLRELPPPEKPTEN